MKFSVLMSVYEKEKPEYLESSIESILNQTVIPNEIVIVKDGPLNLKLENVLNKYKSEYNDLFNYIELKTNQGLGNALNIGVKNCKYNLIARMDSDDVCKETRFEKQLEKFQNNSNIDIVGANITEYDEDMKKIVSDKTVPEKDKDIKKYLKKRNPINHMSVMYKKDKILEVDNYEKCEYFEDYYLWCKLNKANAEFYNIQESLVKVRAGNNMYKRRGGKEYIKSIINFEKKILKLGIINKFEYVYNICIRILIAYIPNNVRASIYKKVLRK